MKRIFFTLMMPAAFFFITHSNAMAQSEIDNPAVVTRKYCEKQDSKLLKEIEVAVDDSDIENNQTNNEVMYEVSKKVEKNKYKKFLIELNKACLKIADASGTINELDQEIKKIRSDLGIE